MEQKNYTQKEISIMFNKSLSLLAHYKKELIEKEYYILKNRTEKNIWEIWIDKETGLPIKEINRGGEKSFFPGTNVVKSVKDGIQEYRYEFDKVTDEDVKIPDLSNYTVENKTLNMEDMVQK